MLELNQIFCGDNVELCKQIDAESIDLTVTSPPYGGLRKYKGFTWDFEGLSKELLRITKSGGVVVWVVADETTNGSESGDSFRQALYFKDLGFNLHDTMIFASKKPPLTHNRFEQEFDYMFVFSKGKPKTFNPIKVPTLWAGARADRPKSEKGSAVDNRAIRSREEAPRFVKSEKIKGNIWEYKTGGGHSSKDKIAFEHPAIFPEALAHDHIISWSNPGDLVLDPFNGSGTVSKISKQLNRNFIGIDCSEEYCGIARKKTGINKL